MQRSQVLFLTVAVLVFGMATVPVSGASLPPVVLDGNLDAGYQAATVIDSTQAGQVVSLEVFGRDMKGATGFSATLSYDPTKVSFVGYTSTDLIPGMAGLSLPGASGSVQVGGISVEDSASVARGRLGVVQFKLASGFSGQTQIALTKVTISNAQGQTDYNVSSTVDIGASTPAPVVFDADPAPGYQGSVLVDDVQAGQEVPIQALGLDIAGASGYSATITFDPTQVSFEGYTAGNLIPNTSGLVLTPSSGTVQVGGVSVEGTAPDSAGELGVARFKVSSGFTGETTIQVTKTTVARTSGQTDSSGTTTITLVGPTTVKTPDFNGNGTVDFTDFIQFARVYGKKVGDTGYDARFDLSGNGVIDFADFIIFAQSYGKTVSGSKPALSVAGMNAGARVTVATEAGGQGLTAVVGLDGAAQVEGYEMVLHYDPAQLQYESASRPQDGLLARAGRTPLFLSQEVQPATLVLADAVVDGGRGAGSGALAAVSFRRIGGAAQPALTVDAVRLFDGSGGVDVLGAAGHSSPSTFGLDQNFPNPFNPATQITYRLPERTAVRLAVYSVTGQLVSELVNTVQEAGQYRVEWNGRDAAGREVGSGVYFYRLEAGAVRLGHKMLLLR